MPGSANICGVCGNEDSAECLDHGKQMDEETNEELRAALDSVRKDLDDAEKVAQHERVTRVSEQIMEHTYDPETDKCTCGWEIPEELVGHELSEYHVQLAIVYHAVADGLTKL